MQDVSKHTSMATKDIATTEKNLESMVDAEKLIVVQNLEKLKQTASETEKVKLRNHRGDMDHHTVEFVLANCSMSQTCQGEVFSFPFLLFVGQDQPGENYLTYAHIRGSQNTLGNKHALHIRDILAGRDDQSGNGYR